MGGASKPPALYRSHARLGLLEKADPRHRVYYFLLLLKSASQQAAPIRIASAFAIRPFDIH
jgi:hypothetical protein